MRSNQKLVVCIIVRLYRTFNEINECARRESNGYLQKTRRLSVGIHSRIAIKNLTVVSYVLSDKQCQKEDKIKHSITPLFAP